MFGQPVADVRRVGQERRGGRFGDLPFGQRAHLLLHMWSALLSGRVSQQASNDPGGDRWRRLIDDAVDMFADVYV